MRPIRGAIMLFCGVLMPCATLADASLMRGNGGLFSDRPALIALQNQGDRMLPGRPVASLFRDTASDGLFAPAARRATLVGALVRGGPVAHIRHVIARAEAGKKGYDAVQHGARIKPGRPPTQMTLDDIFAWIRATPRQPHAIGRYQFIPATLRRLVRHEGLGGSTRFTPDVQDRLANVLLEEAGLSSVQAGEIGRHAFMNNLAKIWAGLPNASGRSHYHGYAGNKATMTWARFDAEMAKVFPG